jgi:hypothetical protein
MLDKTMTARDAAPARDPEALSTDEVRQGETGHGVRYVLAVSLTAALVALAIAWIFVS